MGNKDFYDIFQKLILLFTILYQYYFVSAIVYNILSKKLVMSDFLWQYIYELV
jgi:hypothetical protein